VGVAVMDEVITKGAVCGGGRGGGGAVTGGQASKEVFFCNIFVDFGVIPTWNVVLICVCK
jgi:hypothetical protein